ncbi:MAG: FapA family protein [Oscillospiraceae bacterium]|nr:FapA family protein [Oscillospiraceae bacterium]
MMDPHIERPNTHIPANASASVNVSPDGMRAEVFLTPPEPGGLPVTPELIKIALINKKIAFGIDEEQVRRLSVNPIYHIATLVASGNPPVHGKNAVITPVIRIEKDIRPKELEDGSVDYKDLGIITTVHKGDVLCEKTPPTQGEPGMNVYGSAVAAKPGKDAPLPAGKNTVMSDDKLQLFAACDGHADVVQRKIQVLNVFTVPANVSHSTGNINFLGHVQVNGSVLNGFKVEATGNITIEGTVEGAEVIAAGNVIIKGGVNGSGKGLVKAGGFIKVKYIQSGNVQAGGDIETSFILHSEVHCSGSVSLLGAKGTVVGGRVAAMKAINAMLAGGRNSYVPTTLEVGNDPNTINRSHEIPHELEANKRDAAALLRAINLLSEHKKAGRITPDKLEALQRAISSYQSLAQNAAELEEEMAAIQEVISSSGFGSVNISGTAYPGITIVIGSERLLLESKHDHCSFIRDEQGIQFVPLR